MKKLQPIVSVVILPVGADDSLLTQSSCGLELRGSTSLIISLMLSLHKFETMVLSCYSYMYKSNENFVVCTNLDDTSFVPYGRSCVMKEKSA